MRKEKRVQSRALALFGFPFFAVGVFFIYLVAGSIYDSMRMASWPQTQGVLISAHLRSSTSDNSTTYEAEASYRYRVGGLEYSGDRVAIQGGGDNIGDFQQQLGYQLESRYRNQQPVTVYYNPDDPGEAVLNREMRWGLIGFKFIFIAAFGGAGLGMIIFGLRGKRVIDTPEAAEKPWLARAEWVDNRIRSGARTMVYFSWVFAFFWNLISAPMVVMFAPEVWRDEGAVALLMLLFPLVGLGLLYWAVKQTLEWRRFGYTPLVLDPFPGAIGGDVGGEIALNVPYDPGLACEVTLSSLYSYVTGSGKNRSRHERVEWQDSGYAQVERSGRGMRLRFRFTVPEGLRPSEEESGNYYLWRLGIRAELPGVDLNRSFTIPVYATGKTSRSQSLDTAREVPRGVPELRAESLLPLTHGRVQELYYPMLRRPGLALGLVLFGGVFAGVGVFLWGQAQAEGVMLYLMATIFAALGGVVVMGGLYTVLNSLHVVWDGSRVKSVRRLLGVVIKRRQAFFSEVRGIELKKGNTSTQKGSQHQINYQVVAKTAMGEMVLAEQLDSHSKAKLVEAFFRKQFGLRE